MYKVGIIGLGNLGEALLEGFLSTIKIDQIVVTSKSEATLSKIKAKYSVNITPSNLDLARQADIIILATKANAYQEVIEDILPSLSKKKALVSVTPAFTLRQLEELTKGKTGIIRTIPNTPVRTRQGVTLISYSSALEDHPLTHAVISLFKSVGDVVKVEEEKLAVASTLSGSGPAFVTYFVKSMVSYGIQNGLSEEDAQKLVNETFKGALSLIENSPLTLDEQISSVCSRGGSTIRGIEAFEQNGLDKLIIESLDKVTKRFQEMEKEKK